MGTYMERHSSLKTPSLNPCALRGSSLEDSSAAVLRLMCPCGVFCCLNCFEQPQNPASSLQQPPPGLEVPGRFSLGSLALPGRRSLKVQHFSVFVEGTGIISEEQDMKTPRGMKVGAKSRSLAGVEIEILHKTMGRGRFSSREPALCPNLG